jgi:hypothetical protein
MTINNAGNIGPLIPQNLPNVVGDVNAAKKAPPKVTDNTNQGGVVNDKVEISRQAKTVSKALVNIANLQEIRQQDVQKAIQARVVENNRVPASQLAAKLLLEE